MQLRKAIQTLCDAGVEFVVIGGVAAVHHGSAHVTFDLDICYSQSQPNLRRLASALAPFHPRPRAFPADLPFVWDEVTLRNATVFTLESDLGGIDLLAEVAGVGSYGDALAHSTIVEDFDRRFAMLNLRSLIESKRAANRVKDQLILPELEALLEAQEPPE